MRKERRALPPPAPQRRDRGRPDARSPSYPPTRPADEMVGGPEGWSMPRPREVREGTVCGLGVAIVPQQSGGLTERAGRGCRLRRVAPVVPVEPAHPPRTAMFEDQLEGAGEQTPLPVDALVQP